MAALLKALVNCRVNSLVPIIQMEEHNSRRKYLRKMTVQVRENGIKSSSNETPNTKR